jgi:hypothetical protein
MSVIIVIDSEAYKKGYKAHQLEDTLASVPYPRHTVQWENWREGWAQADWEVWHAALVDKRKASTV